MVEMKKDQVYKCENCGFEIQIIDPGSGECKCGVETLIVKLMKLKE